MSRTTLHWIKTADRRPTHEGAVEYPNAWLAHVMVWSHIGERYGVPFSLLKPEPVWALHARADLPLCDRVVMALTFDRAWVRRENFGRLAEAVAAARLLAGCHFHQAARDLLARADDPAVLGACFHGTSVAEFTWWDAANERHFTPEELDAEDVFDIVTDTPDGEKA